jgi:hypothetical protein
MPVCSLLCNFIFNHSIRIRDANGDNAYPGYVRLANSKRAPYDMVMYLTTSESSSYTAAYVEPGSGVYSIDQYVNVQCTGSYQIL